MAYIYLFENLLHHFVLILLCFFVKYVINLICFYSSFFYELICFLVVEPQKAPWHSGLSEIMRIIGIMIFSHGLLWHQHFIICIVYLEQQWLDFQIILFALIVFVLLIVPVFFQYFSCLLLIFIIELVAGVLAYVYYQAVSEMLVSIAIKQSSKELTPNCFYDGSSCRAVPTATDETFEWWHCLLLTLCLFLFISLHFFSSVCLSQLSEELKQHLSKTMTENYAQPGKESITQSVDRLQQDVRNSKSQPFIWLD